MSGRIAQVESFDCLKEVYLPTEDVEAGDWILIYGSVALAKLDDATALETLSLINNLRE